MVNNLQKNLKIKEKITMKKVLFIIKPKFKIYKDKKLRKVRNERFNNEYNIELNKEAFSC